MEKEGIKPFKTSAGKQGAKSAARTAESMEAAEASSVAGRAKDSAGQEATSGQKLIEQKSTGRTAPNDLKEKLAMEEAMANPGGSHAKGVKMGDPRYPAKDGWIKMEQAVNGTKIHYIKNTKTGAVADFKFK